MPHFISGCQAAASRDVCFQGLWRQLIEFPKATRCGSPGRSRQSTDPIRDDCVAFETQAG